MKYLSYLIFGFTFFLNIGYSQNPINVSLFVSNCNLEQYVFSDLSGITYNPNNDRLFGVRNDGNLLEFDSEGNILRTISISSISADAEGITYMYNNFYAITDERVRNVHIVEITGSGSSLNITLNKTLTSDSDSGDGANNGFEGVAYDLVNDILYIGKEGDSDFNNTGPEPRIIVVTDPMNVPGNDMDPLNNDFTISPACGNLDIAGLSMTANGTLLVVSDVCKMIYEVDPSNGSLLDQLSIAEFDQPEGVVAKSNTEIWVVGELNNNSEMKQFVIPNASCSITCADAVWSSSCVCESPITTPTIQTITTFSAQVFFQDSDCIELHYRRANGCWYVTDPNYGAVILIDLYACTDYEVKVVDTESGNESPVVPFTTQGSCSPVTTCSTIDGYNLPASSYPPTINTDTEALLYFDINVGAYSYKLQYWDVNDISSMSNVSIGGCSQNFHLTNLDPCTSYSWRVRVECSPGLYSPWSNLNVFMTTGPTCRTVEAGLPEVGEIVNGTSFEYGWGIWNDKGIDCRRHIADSNYASEGSYCVRLRDNTYTSRTDSDNINLSSYDKIVVHFSYRAAGMDANEKFRLQLWNGSGGYSTKATWSKGPDYQNGIFYNESVTINGPFSNIAKLRFRSYGSVNGDRVYIDNIYIVGYTSGENSNIKNPKSEVNALTSRSIVDNSLEIMPNPNKGDFSVNINADTRSELKFSITNIGGTTVHKGQRYLQKGQNNIEFKLSSIPPGMYLLLIETGEDVIAKKFIKD